MAQKVDPGNNDVGNLDIEKEDLAVILYHYADTQEAVGCGNKGRSKQRCCRVHAPLSHVLQIQK